MATIRSAIELQDNFTSVMYQVIDSVNLGLTALEELSQTMNSPVDVSAVRDSLARASAALMEYGNTTREQINGGTRAQREMNEEMERGASSAHSLMDAVKGMVATYATVKTVASVVEASDELAQTTARLNLMNDGLQTTQDLQKMIYLSAERARGSYQATADSVSKLGLMAGDAFGSSEEIIAFMEQVNKQFTIAGTEAAGVDAAMLQLTQAMGSGVLRGEEYNSILEQAPNIIQAIADYMEVPKGQLKDMAAEGQITADIVKAAMFAAADETNAQFESMPMTFEQIGTSLENTALMALQPFLDNLNKIANSDAFQQVVSHAADALSMLVALANPIIKKIAGSQALWSFANGAIDALSLIGIVVLEIFDLLVSVAGVVADNWSIVEPVVWGVVAALIAYNAVMGIGWLTTLKDIAAKAAHAVASAAETLAIFALTVAQEGLNAALAACPVTWIIIAIIALISLFYAAVAAVNKFAETSVSATGIICGVVATACALVMNTVIGVLNAILQCMWTILAEPFLTIIEWILNVANGGFDSFGDAVANLVGNIISWFLSLGKVVTKIIDAIFGTDWTAGLSSLQNSVLEWGKNDNAITLDRTAPSIGHRLEYGAAWDAGYNFGEGIEEKIGDVFNPSNLFDTANVPGAGNYASAAQGIGSISDGVGDISENTRNIADSLDITKEELKYLRDIAERDVVNRITAANIKVDMTNNNTIGSEMDLDGITEHLRSAIEEQMNAAAEGVH